MTRNTLWTIGCAVVLTWTANLTLAWAAPASDRVPQWIWSTEHQAGHIPNTACYFRTTISLQDVASGTLAVAADDGFELYVNGHRLGRGRAEQGIATFDVSSHLNSGDNTIALRVTNNEGKTAGLAVRLVVQDKQRNERVFVTDETWKAGNVVFPFWHRNSFSDRFWKPAQVLGPHEKFVTLQQRNLATDNRPATPKTTTQEPRPAEISSSDVVRPKQTMPITRRPESGQQLEVPREFELAHIAGHADVGSLVAMTFDDDTNILAAREDGQLWKLTDQDQDGQYDQVTDVGRVLQICQGLLALGDTLFAIGKTETAQGLFALRDSDGDQKFDSPQLVLSFDGENIEHGPHGLVLGPDGMLYIMVGNHSQVTGTVSDSSPYRFAYEGDLITPRYEDPGGHAVGVRAPGGTVVRTDPRGERVEVVAGGIRNAYDLAFDRRGELFTHDSDMESDRGTTWYRPTRVMHIVPGAEFGWRSGWSKWPDYYFDSLPGIADTGRGSPTGMVFYDHTAFPESYQQVLFSADWSEGRILAVTLSENGGTYRADAQTFIQGEPLNVTDIEVGADGALYFCTGGRGTAGNIYRVTWKGRVADASQSPDEGIDTVLRQPQIHSSWARQRIAQAQNKLGAPWKSQIIDAAKDTDRIESERVAALQVMQWFGPRPDVAMLNGLANDTSVAVRRQVAMQLGLHQDPTASQTLVTFLDDVDPVVRRRACESLLRQGFTPDPRRLSAMLASSDRAEAWAARRLLERIPIDSWKSWVLETSDTRVFLQGGAALMTTHADKSTAVAVLDRSMELMDGFVNDRDFTDLLRLQQLALMQSEMKPSELPRLRYRLAEEYPSSSHTINRELVRLLAFLQVSSIMDRYQAELQRDLPDEDRLHLAIHLTKLTGDWTPDQKLRVFQNLDSQLGVGNSLPGYLQNISRDFGRSMSDAEIELAISQGSQWPAAALAALYRLPESLSNERIEQLQTLDRELRDLESEAVKRLRIGIVAVLARDGSDASNAYLREIYDRDPPRRVEVSIGLSQRPDGENWQYLLRALPLLDDATAREIVVKLAEVRQWPKDADAYRQVIMLGYRLKDQGAQDAIRLLEHWQGFASSDGRVSWNEALTAWTRWYRDAYPDEPAPDAVTATAGGKWDAAALLKHLVRAEQERSGDVAQGELVFTKAQCINCHRYGSQGEAMGPDLTGITKRFLKREILDSVLTPSLVISDQYAAQVVLTTDGRTYTGIVAPGSENETVVLQSTGEKVRIPDDEIDEITPSRLSAMPEGLLDGLTLQEVTDLFAYLSGSEVRVSRATPGR